MLVFCAVQCSAVQYGAVLWQEDGTIHVGRHRGSSGCIYYVFMCIPLEWVCVQR